MRAMIRFASAAVVALVASTLTACSDNSPTAPTVSAPTVDFSFTSASVPNGCVPSTREARIALEKGA